MARPVLRNFRSRAQKSGVVYYYFDAGGRPRKEIPLGSDYVVAVRKWAELSALPPEAAPVTTFIDLLHTYEREELGKLAKSTQATYRSDLKHLRAYFGEPPAPLDAIAPRNIKAMMKKHADKPTTANRLKRLFSTIFNFGRGEGYTDKENPCRGIMGFELDGREVDINDKVFACVHAEAKPHIQDAMDLAEAIGQRPGDVLKMTEQHIKDDLLGVKQGKTKAKRRVRIEGKLQAVLERIRERKKKFKVVSTHLLVNSRGMPLTKWVLRDDFVLARAAAAEKAEQAGDKELAAEIRAMWFYDLRAKAADDTAEVLGDQAAADLLGHDSVKTTKSHYLRRGKIVGPSR